MKSKASPTPEPSIIEAVSSPERLPERMQPLPVTVPDLGVLAHYSALPRSEGAGIVTTLDLTIPRNVVLLQHAISGESESLWDQKPDKVIRVSDMAAHFAESVDEESGELRQGPMLVLIGPDGVFHTGSQYAFRALQMIALLTRRPPWNPPVAIRAVRANSRNKKQYQTVVLAE